MEAVVSREQAEGRREARGDNDGWEVVRKGRKDLVVRSRQKREESNPRNYDENDGMGE